jgi:hypothetical protein
MQNSDKPRISKEERMKALNEFIAQEAEKFKKAKEALDNGDALDDDGYPTQEALDVIEKWVDFTEKGKREWFEFINSIWHLKSWGWSSGEATDEHDNRRKITLFEISTAGWSGNESIIAAMQQNFLWTITWVQSRRGGHYTFEIQHEEEDDDKQVGDADPTPKV